MYRIYWQKITPAFSALPPSLAVVCRRGAMDGKERRASGHEIIKSIASVRIYKFIFYSPSTSTNRFYHLIFTANRTLTTAHFLFPLFLAMLKIRSLLVIRYV